MREKPDHYTLQAKKEGYPARSVYKLEEIQKKFHILKTGAVILDIGASPGSWSLYTLKNIGPSGRITAVDLSPLSPDVKKDPRLSFHQGDAFSPGLTDVYNTEGPYDLVMSDAAPATTGNRTVDTGRSFTIAWNVIDLASQYLKPNGSIVIKLFQGGDEQQVAERIKSLFTEGKIFKPKASRKESFELFLIGKGLKSRSSK